MTTLIHRFLIAAIAALTLSVPTIAGASAIAVIDTSAVVNPALTPTVQIARGDGTDPVSHGSLMLTTIAGPGAPAVGAPVIHYGCDTPTGMVDGGCALEAMRDALARDVRVISLSWSTPLASVGEDYLNQFSAVVSEANSRGAVISAAAYPGGPTFPADLDGVIAVGAAERNVPELPYPGDNADVRLPTENTAGLDASGTAMVRAGSSFATAEFSARAWKVLEEVGSVGREDLLRRVADVPPTPTAAKAPAPEGAQRATAPTTAAAGRGRAVKRLRAGHLSARWAKGRLVVTRKAGAPRGRIAVRWRATSFVCPQAKACSLRLFGPRVGRVRVALTSADGTTAVVAVRVRPGR